MKLLICLAAVIAVASSLGPEDMKFGDTIKATLTECAKETKFKPPSGEKPDLAALSKQPKSKCFVKCMMKKEGMIDDKGDLIASKAEAAGMPKNAIKKCSDEHKQGEVCEKIFMRMKCIQKSMKKP